MGPGGGGLPESESEQLVVPTLSPVAPAAMSDRVVPASLAGPYSSFPGGPPDPDPAEGTGPSHHFRCARCSRLTQLWPGSERATCGHCGWHRRFVACPSCSTPGAFPAGLVAACRSCRALVRPGVGRPATFAELSAFGGLGPSGVPSQPGADGGRAASTRARSASSRATRSGTSPRKWARARSSRNAKTGATAGP